MKRRHLFLLLFLLITLASCGGGADQVEAKYIQGPKSYEPFVALGELTVDTGEFRDFALLGATLFIAAGFEGVRVIDISDLTAPTQIGQVSPFSTDPQSADQVIAVAANSTILATSLYPGCYGFCQVSAGELRIYDSSDPKNPKKIATIDQAASALLLDGALLYVLDAGAVYVFDAAGLAFPSTTLRIFDLTAPSTPRLMASIAVASATRFAKKESLLYLGFSERFGGSDGIQVIDVSNPSSPNIVTTAGSSSAERGVNVVATAQSGLYSASGVAKLHTYPQYATDSPIDVPLPRPATGLSVSGQRLFLTQEEDGVAVFDIVGAAPPAKTNTVNANGKCLSVTTFATVGVIRVEKVLSEGYVGSLLKKERLVFFAFPA